MPVVKVYDVSSVEKVKASYEATLEFQKSKQYETYTKDNIMLVRTTNVFPENGKITPLSDSNHMIKCSSNFMASAFFYDMDPKELEKFETYVPAYRSTVHFTENGLVSSHMYGNFDNQDFIILDPLKNQLDIADIRNFAGQDTFVKGSVSLSKEAVIIVREDRYEDLRTKYPELENCNVVLYKGIPAEVKKDYCEKNENSIPEFDVNDERAIVEQVLMDLGYVPELVGSHYLVQSPTSDKVASVNNELAEERGVMGNGKHNYSDEYQDDFNKNQFLTELFDNILLDFIVKLYNLENVVVTTFDKVDNIAAHILLNGLGKDALIEGVEAFNKTLEYMKAQGFMPVTGDLVAGSELNVYEAYLQMNSLDNNQVLS